MMPRWTCQRRITSSISTRPARIVVLPFWGSSSQPPNIRPRHSIQRLPLVMDLRTTRISMPGIPYIGVFWMKSCRWLILRFELPYWRCCQRAHIAFNLISNLILGNFQVIARLEIHPERRTVVEVASETQGCISSNCALFVDDIGDPRHRDAQVHSNPVHTQPQWDHKLLAENFSWM